MRYGLNRHRRRHIVVSTVYEDNGKVTRRNDLWTIKCNQFTPKQKNILDHLTKLDHGESALIVSITPLV